MYFCDKGNMFCQTQFIFLSSGSRDKNHFTFVCFSYCHTQSSIFLLIWILENIWANDIEAKYGLFSCLYNQCILYTVTFATFGFQVTFHG